MSRLYVCAADHPCLLNGGRFARSRSRRIGVDGDGVVDLDALERALAGHDRAAGLPLVAIHAANNETGVIQPVAEDRRDRRRPRAACWCSTPCRRLAAFRSIFQMVTPTT